MKNLLKRCTGLALAAALLLGAAIPAAAAPADYEHVTSHIAVANPRQLSILYPARDIQTTASGYQITGTSNPELPLSVNGTEVGGRGAGGSFAVWVTLGNGANQFTFRNGDSSASITITKGGTNSASTAIQGENESTKPLPQFDLAIKTGVTFTLRCYSSTAQSVVATVNGRSYQLKAGGGSFSGGYVVPSASGTQDLGHVTYTITHRDGSVTTQTSEGKLYAVGSDSTLQIQVKNTSTTLFSKPTISSAYMATAKVGAVSNVIGYDGDYYKLSMGGWISAKAVQPLTSPVRVKNTVTGVYLTEDRGGETFVFEGDTYPLYAATHTNGKLSITLFDTTGVDHVDVSGSSLFSDATVTEKNGYTVIDFTQSQSGALWGYLVEYGDGATRLYCKYRPRLSGGDQPLAGITVAVDAGHGGTDPGTTGLTYGHGSTEKDVNLAAAIALQKKLELLGATVVMTRADDRKIELSPRLQQAQDARVDFMVSLHCNSAGASSTAMNPSGVEVYYYEPIAKTFAQRIEANVVANTGRKSRGAKYGCFVITLNSYAPSVLVEMGFLLNPMEFDSLTSRAGIYNTVTGISDAIIASLS